MQNFIICDSQHLVAHTIQVVGSELVIYRLVAFEMVFAVYFNN